MHWGGGGGRAGRGGAEHGSKERRVKLLVCLKVVCLRGRFAERYVRFHRAPGVTLYRVLSYLYARQKSIRETLYGLTIKSIK